MRRKRSEEKEDWEGDVHCKKRLALSPSPAGMSLTKHSLVSNIPAGDGKTANLFFYSAWDEEILL